MRRIVCTVRQTELLTQTHDYPSWEIPILRLIHKDQVQEHEEIRTEARVPEPGFEFERLSRRYGFDKETHQPRVEIIYGAAPLGIQRLTEAMKAELDEQAEADRIMSGADTPADDSDEAPERGRRRRGSE